ncbi:MAG: hypothetical protein ABFE13_07515 [Phycisphaerales bacterium]
MTRYAENTSVSVERSRAEIEGTLQRYGASRFMSGWDEERAYIAFLYHDRAIRLTITLPDRGQFDRTPHRNRRRSSEEAARAWEQACRQQWRAMALVVKAKLEAVQAGIATFEDEFLAYTVLPEGRTVAQWLQPQMQTLIETGRMPQMLLPPADVAAGERR